MGCPKITYYKEGEGLEKSTVHFLGGLEEKKFASKFCDSYYPFGLTFNSYTSGVENLYKLTGNEEQPEWDVYDFNARMYDAALGRFNSIDPLADFNQESWNPYHFNYNNPLRFVDPSGLYSTEEWMKDNGITSDDLISVYQDDDDDDDSSDGEGTDPEKKKQQNEVSEPALASGTNSQGGNSSDNTVAGLSIAFGTAEAIVGKISTTLPVYDVGGKLIGHIQIITKGALPAATQAIKVGGNLLSIAGTMYDVKLLTENKMSVGEFAYNATGTIASGATAFIVGGSVGAGAGAIVGGIFLLGKESYNAIQDMNAHYDRMDKLGLINHRNRADSWSDFKNDATWWLR